MINRRIPRRTFVPAHSSLVRRPVRVRAVAEARSAPLEIVRIVSAETSADCRIGDVCGGQRGARTARSHALTFRRRSA